MLEAKIEENKIQEKIAKKKVISKTKVKSIQNTAKNQIEMVWYASILF